MSAQVLATSSYDDTVAWHENDGSESFAEHEITTLADSVSDACAADLDGDSDLDVLAASKEINTVARSVEHKFLEERRPRDAMSRQLGEFGSSGGGRGDEFSSTRVGGAS